MQYVRLGKTGMQVSRLCLGMMSFGSSAWRDWILDEEPSRPLIRAAIEAGINFFDTADMYSVGESEVITGRVVQEYMRRENAVIATKVYNPMSDDPNDQGLSRKHIMQAIDASLKRLGTDYVDLYQIHRFDRHTPIEETLEALNDVVRAGKALYIGASSMYAWQFIRALSLSEKHGWAHFVAMQNHYNLVYREEEREMIPLCQHEGVGVIPWSPLARGFLAGNRTRDKSGETTRAKSDSYAQGMYYQDTDFDVADAVSQLAEVRGVSSAQIALAWMLHKPGITAPIIGVTKRYQLDEAIAALDIHLSADEIAGLEAPYTPHPILGHD